MRSSATGRTCSTAMRGSAAICSTGASRGTSPMHPTTPAPQFVSVWGSDPPRPGEELCPRPPELRQQHSGALAVELIVAAEKADEVVLLVADRDEDVERHARCEQQVADGH